MACGRWPVACVLDCLTGGGTSGILLIYFSVGSFFWPGILVHGSHSHWLTGVGASGILLVFVTYGQGRWLYVVGFFFDLLGFGLLSFILRAFHLWFHSTSLLGALIL